MEEQDTRRAAAVPADVADSSSRLLALVRTPLYANAFYLWVNAAGTSVAGFAFWALVARLWSTDEVGLGSASLSILMLLALLSQLGLGLGLIRFLPESGEQGPALANAAFVTGAAAAVVSSTVFLFGVPLWARNLDFLREQPLYSAAFISFVVVGTFSSLQTYALIAIRKTHYILVLLLSVQLSRLALAPVVATFFGAFGILASTGIAMALGAVVGFGVLAAVLRGYRPTRLGNRAALRKLLPYSVANHLADIVLRAPTLILPLFVVSLLGSAQGAYFYMAWLLGDLLIGVSTYLAMSLLAEGSNDPRALWVLSRKAVAGGLAAAVIGAVFLLLLGDKVLYVFGRDYATEGATLVRIVALSALPAAVVNVYVGALRVTKRVGELLIIAGVVAGTTMGLSYALLPVMGLAGAGVGQGVAQGLGLAIVAIRVLSTLEGSITRRLRSLFATAANQS